MSIFLKGSYDGCTSWASFSECEKYRYSLTRIWDFRSRSRTVCFIGLNPSTADQDQNDPTVTRCMNYAKKWGYGGFTMLNAFAYRATDPKVMKSVQDPVGKENDFHIQLYISGRNFIVAWGNHCTHMNRESELLKWLPRRALCLGKNKSGSPKHPLYLKSDIEPFPFFGD